MFACLLKGSNMTVIDFCTTLNLVSCDTLVRDPQQFRLTMTQ